MRLMQFVFGFLYTRNWYSGEMELSTSRLALFAAALFLILLGVVLVGILQPPVTYAVPTDAI